MCNCIQQANAALAERGLTLEVVIMRHKDDGSLKAAIPIHTLRLDPRGHKVRVMTVLPSFCPFCGEKYVAAPVTAETETPPTEAAAAPAAAAEAATPTEAAAAPGDAP